METKKNLKILLCSIMVGVIITSSFITIGLIERILITISSIISTLIFLYNKKSFHRVVIIVIIGILIGLQFVGLILLTFNFEEGKDTNINNFELNKGKSKTAVILIFRGEAERYHIPALIGDIKGDIALTESYKIPFILHNYRKAYEWAGLSRYKEHSLHIKEELSKQLGSSYEVFLGYSRSKPDLNTIFKEIQKNEYSKLIVVPVFLTENREYTLITKEIEFLNLLNRNIKIKSSDTLFNSLKIIKGINEEVEIKKGNKNRSEIGIIITASRDKNLLDPIDAKSKNQEKLFMEKIKSTLSESGYEERKIKFIELSSEIGDFEIPIQELQQYGVSNIFIISINDIWNFIDQAYRMEKAIKKMELKEGINLSYIEGWGLNDWFIDELEYRIRTINTEDWSF